MLVSSPELMGPAPAPLIFSFSRGRSTSAVPGLFRGYSIGGIQQMYAHNVLTLEKKTDEHIPEFWSLHARLRSSHTSTQA